MRWWDLAATEEDPDKDPDYTAGALVGMSPQGQDGDDAVRLLRSRRRRARRLREGYPEWRRASLPVSEGATGAGP